MRSSREPWSAAPGLRAARSLFAFVTAAIVMSACAGAPKAERARSASKPTDHPDATVFVASTPSVLVSGGGETFLVLDATMSQAADGAPSFRVAYLVSLEPEDARSADVARHASASGALLLHAVTPLLSPTVRAAAVTAVFGRFGGWGVGVPVRFGRDAGAWRVADVVAAVPVPPLPPRIARSSATELGAVRAARTFLEGVDDGDYDSVWALTSAVVKAVEDQSSFVHDLWPAAASAERGARRECFRQFEARAVTLGVGDVVQVCFETERSVDAVIVRLDDDQEWRVARVTHVARVGGHGAAAAGL